MIRVILVTTKKGSTLCRNKKKKKRCSKLRKYAKHSQQTVSITKAKLTSGKPYLICNMLFNPKDKIFAVK